MAAHWTLISSRECLGDQSSAVRIHHRIIEFDRGDLYTGIESRVNLEWPPPKTWHKTVTGGAALIRPTVNGTDIRHDNRKGYADAYTPESRLGLKLFVVRIRPGQNDDASPRPVICRTFRSPTRTQNHCTPRIKVLELNSHEKTTIFGESTLCLLKLGAVIQFNQVNPICGHSIITRVQTQEFLLKSTLNTVPAVAVIESFV